MCKVRTMEQHPSNLRLPGFNLVRVLPCPGGFLHGYEIHPEDLALPQIRACNRAGPTVLSLEVRPSDASAAALHRSQIRPSHGARTTTHLLEIRPGNAAAAALHSS